MINSLQYSAERVARSRAETARGEFDTPRGYLYTRSMKTQKQAPDAQAAALRRRLHMVEGQIEGIVRMMDEERGCIDILTQFKAAQAGLDGAFSLFLQEHVARCVGAGTLEKGKKKELEKIMSALVQ